MDANLPLCIGARRLEVKFDSSNASGKRDADEWGDLIALGKFDLGIFNDAAASQLTGTTDTVGIGCSGRRREQRGCDKELDDGKGVHVGVVL